MLTGSIRKMQSSLAQTVDYHLPVGEQTVAMNDYIGKSLTMHFTGNIFCVQCGRKTNKSFQQGHCYPCFRKISECGNCMIFPEKCHASVEHCDPNNWVHASCLQTHVVYLANSSGLKVGITRCTQMPTRWIDQGAVQALPIFKTSNRRAAGVLETALTAFVNDKTNWRAMLSGRPESLDLHQEKNQLIERAQAEIQDVTEQFETDDIIMLPDESLIEIDFPVQQYPTKIKSFNFDKDPNVSGLVQGIKGQYLLLEQGVINLRKFSGYEISIALL